MQARHRDKWPAAERDAELALRFVERLL